MRIAFIAPYSAGPMRGNITTVRRLSRSLTSEGAVTIVLSADSLSYNEMEQQLSAFKPDLIHGFHAHYCGTLTRKLSQRFRVPYLITITGSDIHDRRLRSHPDTVTAIENAGVVICFSDSDAEILTGFYTNICGSVAVVPQGVETFPDAKTYDFDFGPDAFVLLLPAALRPVKRIEFPLQCLPQLVQRDPTVRLVIAGGVIDQDYASKIRSRLCDTPFATWLGEVPHDRMGSLYTRADLVLNCSSSESMPNTLMEAMSLGRPVLASNISGNRSLIRDEENGWIYDDEEDFVRLVMRLRNNVTLRETVGERGREDVRSKFSPLLEAERHLSLYRRLLA